MKNPTGLGTQRESGGGECRISEDFGLRRPAIQKPLETKRSGIS